MPCNSLSSALDQAEPEPLGNDPKKHRRTKGPLAFAGTVQVNPTTPSFDQQWQGVNFRQDAFSSPLTPATFSPFHQTPNHLQEEVPQGSSDPVIMNLLKDIQQSHHSYLPMPRALVELESHQEKYKKNKQKSADQWLEVLPQLVVEYMHWAEHTRFGRESISDLGSLCSCTVSTGTAKVLLISFDCKQ